MPRTIERECRVRFALEPLWRLAARQLSEGDSLTWEGLADMVGTTRTKLRYAQKKGVGAYDADRWSVALGAFPSMLWPNYYDDVLGEVA